MNNEKWVLVTGASTGIGRACADCLASNGFHVYAGARKRKDMDDLARVKNIQPVKLDVTSEKDVEALVNFIKKRNTGLFGLVNNAGIAHAGPLIDISDKDMHEQFDVNFFGVHRVTRSVLPFIMQSKGRVVMISSDSGFFATPFFGPYCSSKFAIEGYADSLRREMTILGVKVVIIEPGMVTTPIWDKGAYQLEKFKKSVFADIAVKFGELAIREGKSKGLQPADIAAGVFKALTIKKPKIRYIIARNALMYGIIKMMPDRAVDALVKRELMLLKK